MLRKKFQLESSARNFSKEFSARMEFSEGNVPGVVRILRSEVRIRGI